MSADNWAICPQCNLKPNPYHEELDSTLREDYHIGISSDGEFSVSYRGRCTKCGFEKRFQHEEQMDATFNAYKRMHIPTGEVSTAKFADEDVMRGTVYLYKLLDEWNRVGGRNWKYWTTFLIKTGEGYEEIQGR